MNLFWVDSFPIMILIGPFSRADLIESMAFHGGRFQRKQQLLILLLAAKFNWPDGPATV